jgi:RNA polymerase-binding transcription factor DksA
VVDQHPADVGSETFERDKEMSILYNVEAELSDVDRALRRIRERTYGLCEACGRPIGSARLEARPAARFCIEDQARVERGARSA